MNKIIFRKLFFDILRFFIISSLSISIIVWVIQAVNFLDIVSEDGHSLEVYISYSLMNFPKIFSRIMIFVYFISAYYVISKYEEKNEILVFWANGISKISIINFILKISIFFFLIQLTLSLFVVPTTQDKSRKYLKSSNIDFLPNLITEKKFINVFEGLTIFVDEYKKNGSFKNIYIKELIDENNSKIILAKSGKIFKSNNKYSFVLSNGKITEINNNNSYSLNFKETEYDLSKFSSKTLTVKKIQQQDSVKLLRCMIDFYKNFSYENEFICDAERLGSESIPRNIKLVVYEMSKRMIIPLYIFIISLIAASIILKPKNEKFFNYHKFFIFILGFGIMVFSEVNFKFMSQSKILDLFFLILPLILVIFFYLLIFSKDNFFRGKI